MHIYTINYQLIATHERADTPGTRRPNLDHLPPEKVPGLLLDRDACQEEAASVGLATTEVVCNRLDLI